MKIVYVAVVMSASCLVMAKPLPLPYDVFSHQNDDDHVGTNNFLHHLVSAEGLAEHDMHPGAVTHPLIHSSLPAHLSSYYSSSDVHPYTGVATDHVNNTVHRQGPHYGNVSTEEGNVHTGNATHVHAANVTHAANTIQIGNTTHASNVTHNGNATQSADDDAHQVTQSVGGPLAPSVHPFGVAAVNSTTTASNGTAVASHATAGEILGKNGGENIDKATDKKDSEHTVKVTEKEDSEHHDAPAGAMDAGNPANTTGSDMKSDANDERKNTASMMYAANLAPVLTLFSTAAGAALLL